MDDASSGDDGGDGSLDPSSFDSVVSDPLFSKDQSRVGIPRQWYLFDPLQRSRNIFADIRAPEAWSFFGGHCSEFVHIIVIDEFAKNKHLDLSYDDPEAKTGSGNLIDIFEFENQSADIKTYLGSAAWVRGNATAGGEHGTHVSGTIAAVGDNGYGVTGVCQRARLISAGGIRTDGAGTTASVVRAFEAGLKLSELVAKRDGIDPANIRRVYNMSYSAVAPVGLKADPELDFIQTHPEILFVAAAGNSSRDLDAPKATESEFPAAWSYIKRQDVLEETPNLLAVGATNRSAALTGYSNRGSKRVEIAAPGGSYATVSSEGIAYGSTITNLDSGGDGDRVTSIAGTSMSTPVVTGVAALVWSRCPSLTAAQLKDLLISKADARTNLAKIAGQRFLNLERAVKECR